MGKPITRSCVWCGQQFGVSLHDMRRGRAKFCHKRCACEYGNWLRNGMGSNSRLNVKNCKTCGVAFVVHGTGHGAYCSSECVPAYVPRPDRIVVCVVCRKRMTVRQGAKQYCSTACYHKTDAYKEMHHRAKVQRRLKQKQALGRHSQAEWRAKRAEYGGKCAYGCGRKATSRDHIIALANGGSDDIDNIVPACHLCNSHKRDLRLSKAVVMHKHGQMALAGTFVVE